MKSRLSLAEALVRKFGVQTWALSKNRHNIGWPAMVGLVLVLWLTTLALTVSPQLHRLLHRDAQSPNHDCLITQILHQSLLAGSANVAAPTQYPLRVGSVYLDVFQFFPAFDYRLSPSRAPPAVSSSTTIVG